MRVRAGVRERVAVPLRVAQRFALLFLIFAGGALLLMGRSGTLSVEGFRTATVDTFTPVLDVLSRPLETVANIVDEGRDLIGIRAENRALRKENAALHQWRIEARRLAAENASYRALMHQIPDSRVRFVTARVVGDTAGAFVRSIIVNAGTQDGLQVGQAVMTGAGLIGRISTAGVRSARVLLLTDINSRIPVLAEASRARAILKGTNEARPQLAFLSSNVGLTEGERIVTSGHGGLFPPGLAVGTVQVADGVLRVLPSADFETLEFVRVVDYAPVLAPSARPAEKAAKQGMR